ncbi:MAG: FMN-binding protein, partial [Clostridiales bacterium]|nr:FMN-binding protein [Clostridiales bacterium]
MKKIQILCVLLLVVISLGACAPPVDDDWEPHPLAAQLAGSPGPLDLAPGTFIGSGSGGSGGEVSVSVTIIVGGIITAIEVIESDETPNLDDPAFEYLIASVISAQRPDVDAYSGATLSSRAFLNAVWDALEQSLAVC